MQDAARSQIPLTGRLACIFPQLPTAADDASCPDVFSRLVAKSGEICRLGPCAINPESCDPDPDGPSALHHRHRPQPRHLASDTGTDHGRNDGIDILVGGRGLLGQTRKGAGAHRNAALLELAPQY